MATLQELIDEINNKYTVILFEKMNETRNNTLLNYRLIYESNNMIFEKNILIYRHNTDYYWFRTNPIPPIPVISFGQRIQNKIDTVIQNNTNIKMIYMESVNETMKRASLVAYVESGGTVTERKAGVYEDQNGDLQIEYW